MTVARRMLSLVFARATFIRYLLASVCALSADMGLFLLLNRLELAPIAAACVGYVAGLIVHWLLSVHFVFNTGNEASFAQRAAFVGSALIGLTITMVLVGWLAALGVGSVPAKSIAVLVSFVAVYGIRKYGVFADN